MMKRICIFLPTTLLLVVSLQSFAMGISLLDLDTLSIFDAKAQGKLSFAARGAFNPNKAQPELKSSHYGECIDVRIKNNSATPMVLKLENGTLLLSRVNHTQNMLITKTAYYTLQPNEKYIGRITAICGELHKNAPDIYVNYDIGNKAPADLCRLAAIIEQTNEQNMAGQYAVWAASDKATSKELGENYEILKRSQELLKKATINFNIFGAANDNYATLPTQPKMSNNQQQKIAKKEVMLDTADLTVETIAVQRTGGNEGVRIGDTSWQDDSDKIWLGLAAAMLLIFVVLVATLNRKK
jgi:hypothetical protein